jgi:hypothetical protein
MKRLLTEASLIMKPEGQADGLLPSVKPIDGSGDFTFSRGSNLAATRVNQAGLIEKGRENLLTYSNDFTNTAWNNFTDGVTRSESSVESPFGDDDTYSVIVNTGSNKHRVGRTTTIDSVSTFSIYAKANGYNYVRIWAFSGGNTNSRWFNLSDGTTGGAGQIAGAIESVGNNWYRCSVVVDPNNSGAVVFGPAPDESTASGTFNYTGDGISGIYVTRGQFEVGLAATEYIETTTTTVKAGILEDTPRLDYSGGATEPSLLLEPSRTNLYPYSEYSGAWVKTNWTTTDNYAISPEGVQNAFRAVSSNTSGVLYISGLGTTGQDNTLSVWAKSNTGSNQKFRLWGNGNTITSSDFTATNEWQRFDYTYNCTNVTAGIKGASSELSDILFYGFQQEAGSYPTSYIPTYGSAVTRSYENMNNQAIVGDLSNNYTFFFDAVRLLDGDGTQRWFYTTGLNGTNLQVYLISGGIDGRIRLFFRAAGESSDSSITWELGPQEGSRYKIAIVRSEGSLKFFADGSLIGENTNNVPDELTYYNVFAGNGAQRLNQYLIFPTALTDSECIALTSL